MNTQTKDPGATLQHLQKHKTSPFSFTLKKELCSPSNAGTVRIQQRFLSSLFIPVTILMLAASLGTSPPPVPSCASTLRFFIACEAITQLRSRFCQLRRLVTSDFQTCGVLEILEHLLFHFKDHSDRRNAPFAALRKAGHPHKTVEDLTFPWDSPHLTCHGSFDHLFVFLHETGLRGTTTNHVSYITPRAYDRL